jgi:hypothetical protein
VVDWRGACRFDGWPCPCPSRDRGHGRKDAFDLGDVLIRTDEVVVEEDNEGLEGLAGPACPSDPFSGLWRLEGREDTCSAAVFLEDEGVDRGVDGEVEGGQEP